MPETFEKLPITRKELGNLFPGQKVKIRKVSFSGLGYGEAYALSVNGVSLGDMFTAETLEANRLNLGVMKSVRATRTYNGLKII